MAFLLLILFCLNFQEAKTLKDFQWERRVLVLFDFKSLNDRGEELEKQIKERRLLVVQFEGEKLIGISEEFEINNPSFLSLKQVNPSSSKWYLIGLDGGVKASGHSDNFDWEWIFRKIDSMPMRQSEIRNGVKN
ncbi:MAG: DUF4174 domain-containing protein [Algoriphagus sp.]|uniref:DUF4174 domain-containing protein n=1 Tax=Algoriphagus sp. TaxID=1872435 RepID=UPI0017B12EA5|nr:DUF4174 domain-containing protein [Algoriphagus sp.]NVJ87404.1 DUF4174 domain-containing protein [Algoriphagus sp.]